MPTTRILLLRHAETAAPDLFHGSESDVGLGGRGRRQALDVSTLLASMRPDALVCSAMRRARETAVPIAEACGLGIEIVPDLHERRMGSLSGRDKAEGWDDYLATIRRWAAGDLDATIGDAETYAEIRDRVVPALRDVVRRHGGRTVAVVAHGMVTRVALTSLLEGYTPANFEDIAIENAAVNDILVDGGIWRATRLGIAADSTGSAWGDR